MILHQGRFFGAFLLSKSVVNMIRIELRSDTFEQKKRFDEFCDKRTSNKSGAIPAASDGSGKSA